MPVVGSFRTRTAHSRTTTTYYRYRVLAAQFTLFAVLPALPCRVVVPHTHALRPAPHARHATRGTVRVVTHWFYTLLLPCVVTGVARGLARFSHGTGCRGRVKRSYSARAAREFPRTPAVPRFHLPLRYYALPGYLGRVVRSTLPHPTTSPFPHTTRTQRLPRFYPPRFADPTTHPTPTRTHTHCGFLTLALQLDLPPLPFLLRHRAS